MMLRVIIVAVCICLLILWSGPADAQQATPQQNIVPAVTASPTPPQKNGTSSDGVERDEVGEGDLVRVDTTLVTVPTMVLSHEGKYVAGLRREDFRVYENGVEQEIAYFAPVESPITVALLLDFSDSTRSKIKSMREAAIAFIEQLRPGDRAFVVAFDVDVTLLNQPTDDREQLREAIRRARTDASKRAGAGTRLYDAVASTIGQLLNRVDGRKAIVLYTDGVDNGSRSATLASTLEAAEELDAFVYSVQYNTYVEMKRSRSSSEEDVLSMNRDALPQQTVGARPLHPLQMVEMRYREASYYLEALAIRTGGRRVRAADSKKLSQVFAQIAEELRWQYSLGYYPRKPATPGERRQIRVRVNVPKSAVRARASYVATPASRE